MRLEPEIWTALEDISAMEGIPVRDICTLIRQRRRTANLSSAVRVFAYLYAKFQALAPALDVLGPSPQEPAPLVPRMLANIRARERRLSGAAENCEEALAYAIEDLTGFPHPVFAEVLLSWANHRSNRLPAPAAVWGDIDHIRTNIPGDARRQTMAINMIDASADNPRAFRLGSTQLVNSLFAGADISNRLIAEHPFSLHARAMESDFNAAKEQAQPQFHILRQTFRGARRHYARLTLPLSHGGKGVDAIMTVTARLSPPSFFK